jgi:hypothetical protein
MFKNITIFQRPSSDVQWFWEKYRMSLDYASDESELIKSDGYIESYLETTIDNLTATYTTVFSDQASFDQFVSTASAVLKKKWEDDRIYSLANGITITKTRTTS